MIESDTLPQQAIDYLNQIEQAKAVEAAQLGREGARQELLNYCNQWYTTAQSWRKQSFEDDWVKWQRNSDGRYDPALAAKKKDWQAKVFVDLTPTHRETIQAELFRLEAGSRPILDVSARPGGDPAIAEDIRDLELREMEKARFESERNGVIEDKTTYGSGFCRLWWDQDYQDRVVRVPITEPLNMLNPASLMRHMTGQPQILGYQQQTQKQLIYRGVRMQHISIWDVFPDPKALKVKGHAHLIRSFMSLQQIMDGIEAGNFMPEAAMALREEASNEVTPADKTVVQMERGISDISPRREGYQKTWECYEFFVRAPQKWVYPLLKQPLPVDSADCLIPARVIFHKKTILAVELNTKYDGEAPLFKDDYFPVANRYYARGIPEMLKNPQAVANEVVCQRLDEGALALQEGIAVVEKALVNPNDLIEGGPGMVLRVNQKATGPNGDVRNAIMPLGRPDVKINAGFTEVHEWERMAEGRTSANRVVVGNADRFQGANRTLGGQQLLKQTAGEKFAFIQMLSEFKHLDEVFRGIWELIYTNSQPDDIVAALGMERAQRFLAVFASLTPEQIERAYKYTPKGVFERESKAERQGRLAMLREQFGNAPWFDHMANFDGQCKSFDIDPQSQKIPQAEAAQIMSIAQKMAEPMAKQMVAEIVIGQAVKDVERNLAEKMANDSDGAKSEKVSGVPDLAKGKKGEDEK